MFVYVLHRTRLKRKTVNVCSTLSPARHREFAPSFLITSLFFVCATHTAKNDFVNQFAIVIAYYMHAWPVQTETGLNERRYTTRSSVVRAGKDRPEARVLRVRNVTRKIDKRGFAGFVARKVVTHTSQKAYFRLPYTRGARVITCYETGITDSWGTF